MTRGVEYREATAEERVQAVPFAHLSIELGHLYFEDFAAGPEHLWEAFRRVAPWAAAARDAAARPGAPPRVSSCFLVDDYFGPDSSPAAVIPGLVRAAQDCGLQIDYLARESGCVDTGTIQLAQLVEDRIVAEPPPETTGVRPPATEAGWLCNGQRSPATVAVEAMEPVVGWRAPVESAARRHSVFVDVELWDPASGTGERTWSCAFLAAVWQLLRLGLLRYHGAPVVVPEPWDGSLPEQWDQLPAVLQLTGRSAPFAAYRSLSILPGRFLPNEHAVRTILSQIAVEPAVARQAIERASGEGLRLPSEPVDRLEYIFTGGDPERPDRPAATAAPAPSPRSPRNPGSGSLP